MYKVKRSLVLLKRFWHSRGFGIQSPSAYRFVRYVINEHYPYYAYDELFQLYPNENKLTIKLCKLYFRIANYAQAKRWGMCIDSDEYEQYSAYIQAGCHHTQVVDFTHGYNLLSMATSDVLLMTLENNWSEIFEAFVSHVHDSSILIVEDIYATKDTKKAWKQMVDDQRTVITFDLYYCGIILFDQTKTKQHYIINF